MLAFFKVLSSRRETSKRGMKDLRRMAGCSARPITADLLTIWHKYAETAAGEGAKEERELKEEHMKRTKRQRGSRIRNGNE